MTLPLDNPIHFSLTDLFDHYDIDYLWVKDLVTIKYLARFTGSTANLLVGREGRKIIFVDGRYTTQAGQECTVDEVVEIKKPLEDLCDKVKSLKAKSLGFEAGTASYSDYRLLQKQLPELTLTAVDENLAGLRIVKTTEELDKLRASNRVANEAFSAFVDEIHPGWTEKQAAWFLEQQFRERGASGLSFDTLVASGPRAAIVHGKPSDRVFKEGETIIVDRGMMLDHFASDETNTFVLGKADDRQREIYQIVKDAHDQCIDAVKPGADCQKLDAIARDYIDKKGYAEYFGHGTGHGIGLEVHEQPVISPRGSGVLEEGMVFSVEPGIYIPEWGGVRIEDLVVVTADGCEIITLADKNRFVLG